MPLLIYIWVILSFLTDLVVIAVGEGNNVTHAVVFLLFEATVCWVAYEMYMRKKWALITLTIYYFFMAFHLELKTFSYILQTGLNFRLSIINFAGINIPAIFFFVFLVREWRWRARIRWEE